MVVVAFRVGITDCIEVSSVVCTRVLLGSIVGVEMLAGSVAVGSITLLMELVVKAVMREVLMDLSIIRRVCSVSALVLSTDKDLERERERERESKFTHLL